MSRHISAVVCCLSLLFAAGVSAEVKPAALFSDHMVLQRGMSAPIWGTAEPGEALKVTLNRQTRSTTAGADGRWILRLRKLKGRRTL